MEAISKESVLHSVLKYSAFSLCVLVCKGTHTEIRFLEVLKSFEKPRAFLYLNFANNSNRTQVFQIIHSKEF